MPPRIGSTPLADRAGNGPLSQPDPVAQRQAAHELHDNVYVLLDEPDIVHRHDVGMRHARKCIRA
jgi:hypothetical protein